MWRIAASNLPSPIPLDTGFKYLHQRSSTNQVQEPNGYPKVNDSELEGIVHSSSMIEIKDGSGGDEPEFDIGDDVDELNDDVLEEEEDSPKHDEIELEEADLLQYQGELRRLKMEAKELARLFPELATDVEQPTNEADHTVKSMTRNLSKSRRPKHIRYVPHYREPLHGYNTERLSTEFMLQELARISAGPRKHRIVFDSMDPASATSSDGQLRFDASFECGNCRRALSITDTEYNIITNTDVNSQRHTQVSISNSTFAHIWQWFYFSVTNMRPNTPYKFNIINMEKPSSEYNLGMKPLMYSEKAAETQGIGWLRQGTNICYYKSQYVKIDSTFKFTSRNF
jgi:hypothetical protein